MEESISLTRPWKAADLEENTWTFGQTFPVILLAVPLLSIGESFFG